MMAAVGTLAGFSRGALDKLAEGSSADYGLYQVDLPGASYGDFGACLVTSPTTSLLDPTATPAVGTGSGILIVGRDALGQEGSLGVASCIERSRFFAPCP